MNYHWKCKCGNHGTEPIEADVGDIVIEVMSKYTVDQPLSLICADCKSKLKQTDRHRQVMNHAFVRAELCGFPKDRFSFYWKSEAGNQKLVSWLQYPPLASCWIQGDNATGKTWSVCYAGQKYATDTPNRKVLYFDCNDLLRQYSSICANNEGEAVRKAFIRKIQAADLLIIDDIGKENISDCRGEGLCAIVDRANYTTQMIWITSNKSFASIAHCFARPEHANKFCSRIEQYEAVEVQAEHPGE
jgi:IstB-like ATP binding protein